MAQQRVYRDALRCPQCDSNWLPEYAKFQCKQTCRCGPFFYHFTQGMGLTPISRVGGLKGAKVYPLVQKARALALDEQWTCVQSRWKEKRREVGIWTPVIAETDGRCWVDFELGDRNETTFLRLLALVRLRLELI